MPCSHGVPPEAQGSLPRRTCRRGTLTVRAPCAYRSWGVLCSAHRVPRTVAPQVLRVPRAALPAARAAVLAHLLRRVHLPVGAARVQLPDLPRASHPVAAAAGAPARSPSSNPARILALALALALALSPALPPPLPLNPNPIPNQVRPLDALSHKLACKALADDERQDWEALTLPPTLALALALAPALTLTRQDWEARRAAFDAQAKAARQA